MAWNISPHNSFFQGKMRKICWCTQVLSLFFYYFNNVFAMAVCTKVYDKLNTYLVVPDLNQPVICTWNEIWLVSSTVIVNAVYSFLMAFQSKVGWRGAKLPHLPREKKTTKQNQNKTAKPPTYVVIDLLHPGQSRYSDVLYNSKDTVVFLVEEPTQLLIKLPILK